MSTDAVQLVHSGRRLLAAVVRRCRRRPQRRRRRRCSQFEVFVAKTRRVKHLQQHFTHSDSVCRGVLDNGRIGVQCVLKIAIYGQKSIVGRIDTPKNETGSKRMLKNALAYSVGISQHVRWKCLIFEMYVIVGY